MKRKLLGVWYDTDTDEPLGDNGDGETLHKTPSSQYYLEIDVYQVRDGNAWRLATDDDTPRMLPPVYDGADPEIDWRLERRKLHTIKPLTREQAVKWTIETYMPQELATEFDIQAG